jgi:uncharacterized protein (UPF0179 family)
MVMLTVIGKKLAKEGLEFTYLGPVTDCKECKVRNICFHLEKGTKYRVVDVRKVNHDCPVHEGGVTVVQVEEVPRDAIVSRKLAIEGSTISYERPRCRQRSCENWSLCFVPGLEQGYKKKVTSVGERVECRAGQNRVRVKLE